MQEPFGQEPSSGNQFPPPSFFAGNVRQKFFRQKAKPVWENSFQIGESGKYFTQMRFYAHKPTWDFPEPGIFLAIQNPGGYAFTKLRHDGLKDDIDILIKSLQAVQTELATILPALESDSKIILEQQSKAAAQIEVARQLAGLNFNNPNQQGG